MIANVARYPLLGRRIVVTRAQPEARVMAVALQARGAEAVELPCIAFAPPLDPESLAAAVAEVSRYSWVVFTSPRGVEWFFDCLQDVRRLDEVKVAAIGPMTAKALAKRQVVIDLVPEEFVAESLLEALTATVSVGQLPGRVLIPRAAKARDVLPDGLVAAGWEVDVVSAYRTVLPARCADAVALLADAAAVTFTSSSTVNNFLELYGTEAMPEVVAAIGPVTAAVLQDRGISVNVEATTHTVEGLIAAIEDFFA